MDKVAGTGPLLNAALEAVYDVMTLTYGDDATPPARFATCSPSTVARRCAWRWPSGASGRRTCTA